MKILISILLIFSSLLPLQAQYKTREVLDIALPSGFERVKVDSNSIGFALRKIGLEEDKTIYFYNGNPKPDQHFCYEVLKIDVGTQNLQQCADAAIRLWAEYLYSRKSYNLIHFNFTSGDEASYEKWREGYRVFVNGNQVKWVLSASQDDSYENFRKYLDQVFMYAGSYSIEKELVPVDTLSDIRIGDVLIKGGSPGHVMIIFDLAQNPKTGEMLMLLAQSAIPAQSVHIVINENDPQMSPWYRVSDLYEGIQIQEWRFERKNLKRFETVHWSK